MPIHDICYSPHRSERRNGPGTYVTHLTIQRGGTDQVHGRCHGATGAHALGEIKVPLIQLQAPHPRHHSHSHSKDKPTEARLTCVPPPYHARQLKYCVIYVFSYSRVVLFALKQVSSNVLNLAPNRITFCDDVKFIFDYYTSRKTCVLLVEYLYLTKRVGILRAFHALC